MVKPRGMPRSEVRPARVVDIHVGRRIRDRRRDLAVGRARLAAAVGISQEQLRRYEAGSATLVASRLHQIGAALSVPAGYFFEGMRDGSFTATPAEPEGSQQGPTSRELSAFTRYYRQIEGSGVQRQLAALIGAIAQLDVGNGIAPMSDPTG